jgi:cysteine synthase A
MTVADRLAREPRFAGQTIVVVLPDTAERYFTGILFDGQFDEVVNMTAI